MSTTPPPSTPLNLNLSAMLASMQGGAPPPQAAPAPAPPPAPAPAPDGYGLVPGTQIRIPALDQPTQHGCVACNRKLVWIPETGKFYHPIGYRYPGGVFCDGSHKLLDVSVTVRFDPIKDSAAKLPPEPAAPPAPPAPPVQAAPPPPPAPAPAPAPEPAPAPPPAPAPGLTLVPPPAAPAAEANPINPPDFAPYEAECNICGLPVQAQTGQWWHAFGAVNGQKCPNAERSLGPANVRPRKIEPSSPSPAAVDESKKTRKKKEKTDTAAAPASNGAPPPASEAPAPFPASAEAAAATAAAVEQQRQGPPDPFTVEVKPLKPFALYIDCVPGKGEHASKFIMAEDWVAETVAELARQLGTYHRLVDFSKGGPMLAVLARDRANNGDLPDAMVVSSMSTDSRDILAALTPFASTVVRGLKG